MVNSGHVVLTEAMVSVATCFLLTVEAFVSEIAQMLREKLGDNNL